MKPRTLAAAAAIAEQAEKAATDATAHRARVDELTAQMSARTEELSARTAERDAARAALEEQQQQSKALERVLTSQNTELAAELETNQTRLRECDARSQTLVAEHHLRDTELRTRIGETQVASVARSAAIGGCRG